MQHCKVIIALLGVFILFVSEINAQAAPAIPTGFFTSEVIEDILDQKDCAGIRVYPAGDSRNGNLTMMVIGIDGTGKEIYSEIFPKAKYMLFKGIANGRANYDPLNKNNALDACDDYSSAGNPKFLADFSSSTLTPLLTGESQGIQFNVKTSGGNNFSAGGAKISGNGSVPVGSVIDGDPCPAMCGTISNYLCPTN